MVKLLCVGFYEMTLTWLFWYFYLTVWAFVLDSNDFDDDVCCYWVHDWRNFIVLNFWAAALVNNSVLYFVSKSVYLKTKQSVKSGNASHTCDHSAPPYYSPFRRGAEFCDEHVCLSVSLSRDMGGMSVELHSQFSIWSSCAVNWYFNTRVWNSVRLSSRAVNKSS